jgi:hypothetical protein
MASITLSSAALVDLQGAAPLYGLAGEAIAQGQFVYRDSITGKFFKAKADAVATRTAVGVAQNGAGIGAPLTVAPAGLITGITGLTAGTAYVLSAATAGAIAPVADLLSTNSNVLIGFALTTTSLLLGIKDWGYALP